MHNQGHLLQNMKNSILSTKHGIEGYREGFISEDENLMSIKVQWDTDNNHIVDSCFKFTFYKVN